MMNQNPKLTLPSHFILSVRNTNLHIYNLTSILILVLKDFHIQRMFKFNLLCYYNFNVAKAPPCSRWDTGRVVPFVLVLLTDGIYLSLCILVTYGQNIILIFHLSDAFIGYFIGKRVTDSQMK